MDGIQGAILEIKLKYLPEWTRKRQENATRYNKHLVDVKGITLPECINDVEHVYHLYVIQTDTRDALQTYLNENSIQSGLHYPCLLYTSPSPRD